ncbi:hypothetical protein CH379_014265 [Leptospira ellisii]|uniref:Saccharopine dehydrogenase n=2 Tax=Leptospira ellisii TaxID=2023197 RepID=A0AAE4QQP8_9LEPT|nr:hypothetical protein [Leptospira ellisii]MDV6236789.1 hypothetical protein [Leptospira ellisii]
MKRVGIVGYSGHFGKVITVQMTGDFPDVQFILLGRKKTLPVSENVSFVAFDYLQHRFLPEEAGALDLILDLTGPVRNEDGRLFELCAAADVPYMDMAIHNSHLDTIARIRERYPKSTAFVYFGFFPGVSNLMLAAALQENERPILIGEFPVYAGGGKNVSLSLSDLMNESEKQYNVIDGSKRFFRMHSEKRYFVWNGAKRTFYRWEYPEIGSLARSFPKAEFLERYFSIKPAFLNPVFDAMISFWNSRFSFLFKRLLPFFVYSAKSTIFSKQDPPLEMKVIDRDGGETISLRAKSGVSFHGSVMSLFFRALKDRKIGPGLYTPEQLFHLSDILKEGDREFYSLIRRRKKSAA